jgi:hypothetical protein
MGLKSASGGWRTDRRYIPLPEHEGFVLTDISFWTHHEQELDEWCEKNFCVRKGMTVTALNEYGYILFGLRWS